MNLHSISYDDFKRGKREHGGLVVMEFTAPGRHPAKSVEPLLYQLASQYAGRVTVVKVDVEGQPSVAKQYNVGVVPTTLFFSNGLIIKRIVGMPSSLLLKTVVGSALPAWEQARRPDRQH